MVTKRLTFIPLIRNLDDKWSRKDGGLYFLFNMKGEGKKMTTIDCIPMVCEFVDVFPKELHVYLHTEISIAHIGWLH